MWISTLHSMFRYDFICGSSTLKDSNLHKGGLPPVPGTSLAPVPHPKALLAV